MINEEIINFFLDKNFLLTPDLINILPENFDYNNFINLLTSKIKTKDKPMIINKDMFLMLGKEDLNMEINWNEFEKSRSLFEKGRDGKVYTTFLEILYKKSPNFFSEPVTLQELEKHEGLLDEDVKDIKNDSNIIILKSYDQESCKREVNDFVSHFRSRYESIKKILSSRQELQNVSSINRIINKNSQEEVGVIGLVLEKSITKNGNILLIIEDLTGKISVLVNKAKLQLYDLASLVIEDDVIGIKGVMGNKIIFVNNLFLPDIPINKELKMCEEEVYAVFTADLHVGSNLFLQEDFKKLVG